MAPYISDLINVRRHTRHSLLFTAFQFRHYPIAITSTRHLIHRLEVRVGRLKISRIRQDYSGRKRTKHNVHHVGDLG